MTTRRKQPEQGLQQAVAKLLDMILADPVVYTAIGHGGGGAVRGAILKSMGVKAGFPDVIVSVPIECGRIKASLMVGIELKSKDGSASFEQKRIHEALTRSGWHIFICRSVEEVVDALREAGVPMRPVHMWPTGAFQVKERV